MIIQRSLKLSLSAPPPPPHHGILSSLWHSSFDTDAWFSLVSHKRSYDFDKDSDSADISTLQALVSVAKEARTY